MYCARSKALVENQGGESSRKMTYEELQTLAGTEPWGCAVTMILKSSGTAARSAMSDCWGSGGSGCTMASCSRIEKMISSAGASCVSMPVVQNCSKELFS